MRITVLFILDGKITPKIVISYHFGGTTSILKYINFIYKDAIVYLDRKYQKVLELKSRFKKWFLKLSEGELLENP